ncbi:hypothetical protein [Catellatospora sp. NPDC049609]|uniref:hypothetical protein n=1 Tax=Catellatospora sp. NPDC049609 TaxID=3155505 RepID=UPI003431154B
MEVLLCVLVVGAVLIALMVLTGARRSRSRSSRDPSKDVYQDFPRGTEVHPNVIDQVPPG